MAKQIKLVLNSLLILIVSLSCSNAQETGHLRGK